MAFYYCFFLIGGGSACLSLPIDGISPNEKMEFIKYLTRQGATIEELNSIRSQISKVKGGKLLEAASRASFIHTFILSGNRFAVRPPRTGQSIFSIVRRPRITKGTATSDRFLGFGPWLQSDHDYSVNP